MNWLHPLQPVYFSGLPESKNNGFKPTPITYKGKTYKSVKQCADANGVEPRWMRTLLRRAGEL